MGHLRHAVATDIGRRRENNEDNYGVFPEQGIFCVSDGMGGGDDGEVASEATVNAIRDFCAAHPWPADGTYQIEGIVQNVCASVNAASSWIYGRAKEKKLRGCGATFVGICFDAANPGEAVALHAGDSRLYRIRGRNIQQITRDHSAAELIGAKSEKDINPMFRGMILRAVGIQRSVVLERTPLSVKAGDRILICSDGLSRMVPDKKMLAISRANADVSSAVAALIAAANAAGGIDNITAVLVEVGPLPEPVPAIPFPEEVERTTETGDASSTTEGTDTAEDSSQSSTTTAQTDSATESVKSASTEETLPQVDAEPDRTAPLRRRPWLEYGLSALVGMLIVALIVVAFNLFARKESLPPSEEKGGMAQPLAKQPHGASSGNVDEKNPGQPPQAIDAEIGKRFLASCSGKIDALVPFESRQNRLLAVLEEIDGAVASNVVSEADAERLRESVRQRQTWIVGRVANLCSSDVLLPLQGGDKWIATNAADLIVFTNGLPKRWIAVRDRYEDKELPQDFDGREIALKDGDFRLKSVLVKIPLEDSQHKIGMSCWIADKRIGEEKHVLGKPGDVLVGNYRRKGYENQDFRYEVTFDMDQSLPSPTTNWVLRPVSVSVPDLPKGVTCWIGGLAVKGILSRKPGESLNCVYRRSGYADTTNRYLVGLEPHQTLPVPSAKEWKCLPVRMTIPHLPDDVKLLVDGKPMDTGRLLMPGDHVCRYERADYRPQQIDFEVKVGVEASLPPPNAWHETADALKLSEIEVAISNNVWGATNELRGVQLKSKANVERLGRLNAKIREHEAAERRRIEASERKGAEDAKRSQDKAAEQMRAEAAERQRVEKAFEEAFKTLTEACKPDAVKEILSKASSIQILKKGNGDLQECMDACRKAKTLDDKTASLKKTLVAVRGLAEELGKYWAMEMELRKDNPDGKLNGDDEMRRADAVKKAETFLKNYNDSNRQKLSATMRAAVDFLTSFMHAPFR